MSRESEALSYLMSDLNQAWENVTPVWRDDFQKNFEENNLSQMKTTIDSIKKLVDEFYLYTEKTKKELTSINEDISNK